MFKLLKSKRAQATIELTAAWIVLLILLIGATGLFLWFNARIVNRQKQYERTRLYAGKLSCDEDVDVYCYLCCNYGIFCELGGKCHKPYADVSPIISGAGFYTPEPLKIFKK